MTQAEAKGQRGWNDRLPPASAYKPRPGLTRDKRSLEQDRAAGGRHRRTVLLAGGSYARASIQLRLYRSTRRIQAYLRWSDNGVTKEKHVCDVDAATRAANLALAWAKAREAGKVVDEPLPAHSTASSVAVRTVMRANKGRDTKPELTLRSALHRRGLRYRVGIRPLPELRRTADVVFPKAKVAVFVDGCFWHGCPDHYRPAKKSGEAWSQKIKDNRDRDASTVVALKEQGWTVLRFWEHEDLEQAAEDISAVLAQHRSPAPSQPSRVAGSLRARR
ncbi:very short patch repair endonuclease [Streptomyces sp. NPDC057680]|uniref:very short patch repair endonuclease n=1 Tax=Streptomyces sp. NPDC057680 TaxID=3346208 RepID=UPI0036CA110D